MMKNGYVRLGTRNPNEIKHEAASDIVGKLYIEPVSSDIDSHKLIGELLNSSFSYEEKPVFKFFFLYQIIELLMDCIYQNEQELLIGKLIDVKGDLGKTKDALDKIQKFMSEKNRIKLLASNYTKIQSDLDDLKLSCNSLLAYLGREESNNFEGYFYRIRNFIFHQYRDFPTEGEEKLNEVIQDIINLMPSILYQFSKNKHK